MNKKLIPAVLLLLALSGCAGTQENFTYTMTSDIKAGALLYSNDIEVALLNGTDSDSLMVRTSEVSVHPALSHQWSGGLESQLKLIMADEMGSAGLPSGTKVTVKVLRFEGSTSGEVAEDCLISASRGGKTLFEQPLSYRGAQSGTGYAKLALELRRGFYQIASEAAALMR
ncbi:MAG: ABC-type transport auxiliary lipoprotein family protein [Succinivibrio sp.]|jgi:uncharacterized lipoprotein YmbA|nr:ABC-type transport auxiliary lipoprotein family protein [Succinivibrio sp.]